MEISLKTVQNAPFSRAQYDIMVVGTRPVVCVKNVVLLSLVPQIETWFLR
jgi:hypothetical protein